MSRLDLSKLTPEIDKAAVSLEEMRKSIMKLIKDRRFQIGILTASLPSVVIATVQIRKYKKQVEEKENLYKTVIAKQNAVIKELNARADIVKERQDRLMAYDSMLKKEMSGLQSKIQEFGIPTEAKEKKKADDE